MPLTTESNITNPIKSALDPQQRLERMQRIALSLLFGMAALYALALSQRHVHPAVGFVVAFAEAAMVGAIADWFAVVALFRRPMGIRIWHTAVIPQNKDAIGRNLGEFVENHFITEDAVLQRLRSANPARLLGNWLLAPSTTPHMGNTIAQVFEKILNTLDDTKISRLLASVATKQLAQLDVSATAGQVADLLVTTQKHQELLNGVLAGVSAYLGDEKNHSQISDFLVDAVGAENFIYKKAISTFSPNLITSLNLTVVDVQHNSAHTLRKNFDIWVKDFVAHLKSDAGWQASIAQYQQDTLSSPQVEALLNSIWGAIKLRLQSDLNSDDPVISAQWNVLIKKAGDALANDTNLHQWLNQSIESGCAALVHQYRGEVGQFIEAQLAQWTKEEMSQRIELAIGSDLQFIRITGTLVGGSAGLVIYALTQWFGHA